MKKNYQKPAMLAKKMETECILIVSGGNGPSSQLMNWNEGNGENME